MYPATSTVIAGIRNVKQSKMNTAVSDLPDLSNELLIRLRKHAWKRNFWYNGK
jgi:hypothetical protein